MTVITITYNEAFILPHFIAHYRKNFPACKIIVYDNYSTDNTVEIAQQHGCEVIMYDTGGKLSDAIFLEIKNHVWKACEGWVIVCDADEFLDLTAEDLFNETKSGTTIIRTNGYNMVNLFDSMDFEGISHGVRSPSYDKQYCFNADKIKEINYTAGCHNAFPVGQIKYSESAYRCRHYKYINIEYMIARHKEYGKRLSEENLQKGWSTHYLYAPEKIRNEFIMARKKSIRII
jgi:glycosyltransferase involved in cell wall biosynthesis